MKKNSFAIRYILSYVLVVILPITGLLVLQYRNSIRTTEAQFGTMQQNVVAQVRNTLELEMQRMPQIRSIISLDGSFSPAELAQSNYANYTAIQRLKEFTLYSNVISSVILYSDNLPFILTGSGSVTKTYFGDQLFGFEQYSQDELLERIETVQTPQVTLERVRIPNEMEKACLVYWYPVRNYTSNAAMVLLVFVDVGQLETVISSMKAQEPGCFAIMDESGSLIISLGFTEVSAMVALGSYESSHRLQNPITIDDRLYFVSCSSGETTGWTYLYYTAYDQITADLRHLRYRLLTVALIMLCASGVVLYLFLKINYIPIRRLESRVRRELALDDQKNELQTIQDGFQALKKKIDWVNACMQQSRSAIVRHGLEQLLEGHLPTGIYSGTISEPKDSWMVAVAPGLDDSELSQLRADMQCENTSCYYYLLVNQGMTVLLLNMNAGGAWEAADRLRCLFRKRAMEAQLCMSSIGTKVEEIPHLYFQARAGLMQSPLLPHASETPQQRREPSGYFRELEAAIRTGNVQRLSQLRSLFGQYSYDKLTLGQGLNCLLSLWQAATFACTNKALNRLFLDRIELLRQTPKVSCFEEFLDELMLHTEQALHQQKKAGASDNLANKYKSYLQAHYLDDDFSITSMAEKMGVSSSHMSNTFKNAHGFTMIEYVNQLKMKKAIELMQKEDISLAELARRLRYQSASSFIRAFKKVALMTPRQYLDRLGNRPSESQAGEKGLNHP